MEKHCAFLNCGQDAAGRQRAFADVSSAIGFEFLDDGRGLALVDWDFDGDLDVWSTNRTAPRVRFLKNSNKSGNHFIAFQLQGDGMSTNRDAIGARLELHVSGEKIPVVKTLHAGHAFLSQSSRWLHFGLGKTSELDKLVVRWPNGTSEEVGGLVADESDIDIHLAQLLKAQGQGAGDSARILEINPRHDLIKTLAKSAAQPGASERLADAAHLLLDCGAHVTLTDTRPASEIPEAVELTDRGVTLVAGDHPRELWTDADTAVFSPGIRPDAPVTTAAREAGVTILARSEEHTSELQSRSDLVCRLLLEKKKEHHYTCIAPHISPA